MKIYYGIDDNKLDITDICLVKLLKNNHIIIPVGDVKRANIFSDPAYLHKKKIYIYNNQSKIVCDEDMEININILYNTITIVDKNAINLQLKNIHSKLKINYGTMDDEYIEQFMSMKYLTGKEKVLEIGGNIGRNSLIIASILENNENLVTLESDINIASKLKENRDLNNYKFNIESSALSKRKLMQKDWITKPSEILEEGYFWINTITFEEIKKKYNIEFDTLVLDCEGAFYYILMDMPEILNNIKLIIMENDYNLLTEKEYVDNILKENNFAIEYSENGGWGPCYNNFYEVWKKY